MSTRPPLPGRAILGRTTPASGGYGTDYYGHRSGSHGGGYSGGYGGGGGDYDDDGYGRRGRVRPRWGRIFLVLLGVVVVLALVAGLGAWAYVSSLNDDMRRTDAFAGLDGHRAPKAVAGPLNILLLGSDSRDPDAKQDSGKWRTDTIILLHVPSTHDKAYLISLPRDLWVQVPESPDGKHGGVRAKLNAAYAWGGPPLMVQTVENFTGVHIDHVAIVDFFGFKQVVDAVGGVRLCPEMPPGQDSFKSIHKPFRTFKKGCQMMSGKVALDYIRQRKQFPTGDFARMKHQQDFLKALMDKATSNEVFTDPAAMNAFLRSVTKAVIVDDDFSLLDMAIQFRKLRSKDLIFMTSPHRGTGMIDGQSVIVSDKEKAASLYEAVANDQVAEWVKQNPPKKNR
ncbi:MAG TPA: LCP family protein [Micromonosporaceae bacterium]